MRYRLKSPEGIAQIGPDAKTGAYEEWRLAGGTKSLLEASLALLVIPDVISESTGVTVAQQGIPNLTNLPAWVARVLYLGSAGHDEKIVRTLRTCSVFSIIHWKK